MIILHTTLTTQSCGLLQSNFLRTLLQTELDTSVTMSYNQTGIHKKRRIAHSRVLCGTASAPFVPAQGLIAHGNSLSPHPRPLSTAVLARTIGKLPKHHASASAKSRDVNSTGDFTATLLESALASNPTLTGGVLFRRSSEQFMVKIITTMYGEL